MNQLLNLLGLHLDQQSLSNLWAKGLGLASLVAGGFLNPASVLHDGFGILISEAANGRIKWWAVAIGAIVTYITSQNTDRPTVSSGSSSQRGFARLPMMFLLLLLGVSILVTSACFKLHLTSAPTPVAAVADVATKIEQSANTALHAAETATTTPNPLNAGKPLVSRAQLDQVALVVDKIGRSGKLLRKGLSDYAAVKAAGGDLSAQRANVQKILADLTNGLNSVGKSISSGTVAAIDQAVNEIFGLIAQVKAGVL